MEEVEFIGPSSPKQAMILNQSAQVAIVGGASGSGKSYISLLYPLKYADDPYFRGIIFRKTTGELSAQGGLWEIACELYPRLFGTDSKGRSKVKIHKQSMRITFPSGASVKFSHMEHDQDRFRHQGAQYTFVLFDEATHFSQVCIEYLQGRIRSARAKHRLQMVLTCNPDPDWFALDWIKPYLMEDGTPDATRDGVVRYYVVDNNEYIWADDRKTLEDTYGAGTDSGIKSFTFISANCMDNIPLMKNNPSYISELKAKPYVDVQRYLYGNWFVRPSGSGLFKREWVEELDQQPPWAEIVKTVRAYDFAGTLKSDSNPSPDYTACVKMSKLKDGTYFIHEGKQTRIRFGDWKTFIIECAREDGPGVDIILPIDPNPASKAATMMLARELSSAGFYVRTYKASGSKVDRFRPFASLALNGGVRVKRDSCIDYENGIHNDNNFFYKQLEAFDGMRRSGESGHDDLADCCSDAFMSLAQEVTMPNFSSSFLSTNLSFDNPFHKQR